MVNLVCTDKKDNFTVPISFDEKNQLVLLQSEPFSAFITDRQVVFTAKIGKDKTEYSHRISRDTGAMTVTDTRLGGLVIATFDCKIARKQF